MIYFYCVALLVLCGQVELFKLGLLPAPQPEQAEYYPVRQQQQQYSGYQHQIYAGRPQQLPYQQPYQPPALAYVIVRPIAPSYPYFDSSVRYLAPLHQAAPELQQQQQQQDFGVKGGERLQPAFEQQQQQQQLASSTKGAAKPEYIKQEELPAEPANQPLPPPPQSDQLYDMGMGKLLKIKSSIDKFAASAKSKLSIGSHYYVAGEEYLAPVAPPQPLRQEQLQATDIQLTKQEQQHIEDAGQVKLETQQQLEDTRQTKLEETRGTKQAEEIRQIKQEEAPTNQIKLEETRQEKLTEQEPLRDIKGLEQQPLQQERYADKGREYQQPQQQREEYQHQQQQQQQHHQKEAPLKANEARDQLRFNGQQPPTYLSGQTDLEGFGKRFSAL